VVQNIAKSRELAKLLSSFTAAEEAAIRQITPLISIVSLKEGNIGAKGNTHLVWQQSKLQLILPNLPQECKFIIMKRGRDNSNGQGPANHGRSQLKSTKFERHKIARALELLVETIPDVWKATSTYSITVSQARLDMWPHHGDLAELNPELHIEENPDANNNELHIHPNEGRVTDGNDMGPAPLQNAEEPDEVFEGVINYGGGSNVTSAASIPATIANHINQHQQGIPLQDLHHNAPLPSPVMTSNNETAAFNQAEVLSTDGFVNMNKTRYAWARAFPTVFIPEYLPFPTRPETPDGSPYEWKWVIRNDITGWINVRDKQPKFDRWYRQLMWRYDGIPASHPTFSLALFNYKCQQSLQRQGQFVVNTSDIDPDSTIKEVFQNADDQTRKQAVERVVNQAHCHSGNIPGTPRYWKNTFFFEFEAVTQYHSHVLHREPSFFITNSLADHHEFPLRMMLHNYTQQIKRNTTYAEDEFEEEEDILNNDAIFSMHSQKYKTVVTHYFAAKVELWYTLVLQPLLGIDICTFVHEFQSGRGAIHSHSLAYSEDQPWNEEIKNALHDYALHVHSSLKNLDEYIKNQCSREELNSLALHRHERGMERREKFLSRSQGGKEKLKEFEASLGTGREMLECRISETMETYFGFSAMHHGDLPSQWVKPGGQAHHGYRSQTSGMASSKDVLDTRELKVPKFQRENDLLTRRVNITNHCGTHKCSEYCIKVARTINEPYDASKHDDDQRKSSFVNREGIEMIPIHIKECRMHFGAPLEKDFSGENNITGGIPFSAHGRIEFDKNQLPKYVACRNHPRIIAEPTCSLYFGANNDIQPLLINSSYETLKEEFNGSDEEYDCFFRNLLTIKMGGLEHFNASHTINQYLTSYQCKGGKSTDEWKHKIQQLTESFCSDVSNEEKSIRSLIGKHMHDIPKAMSVTRDQSQFMLGGGILKRTSYGTIRRCSVSSLYWEDLLDCQSIGAEGGTNPKRFVWPQILSLYKARSADLHDVSVYTFCCNHWPLEKKQKPVQFFGFDNVPTWPLTEKYSKWILTLYYPWVQSPEELHQPTFASFLTANYMSDHIPSHIRAGIHRARYNLGNVELDGHHLDRQGAGSDLTPTTQRIDERLIESSITNDFYYMDREAEVQGMSDEDFDRIPLPDDNFNWKAKLLDNDSFYEDSKGLSWIIEQRDIFYQDRCATMLEDDSNSILQLFDEGVFRPENAKGTKQKTIVFMLLYQHYMHHMWTEQVKNHNPLNGPPPPPPPSIFLFVEGKPGSGKSFILKTLRNISRKVMNSNSAEITSAPTGVAGSLINASTHCRVASLPTGKEVSKCPYKMKTTKYQQVMSLAVSHQSIFTRLMDEHSMMGRKQFAWMKHRMEELRRPLSLVNDHGEEMFTEENHPLPQCIYERPFGGIPFIMSCGDFAQLPAVMDKMLYDKSPGAPNTADMCGRVAFSEFINSSDREAAVSAVVIMDEVVRQDDTRFKEFLHNIGNGSVTIDDVELIRSRCLRTLGAEEKKDFQNAIHLVSTWAEASSIVVDYLLSIGNPIAKWKASFSSCRRDGKNCCFKEKSFPSKMAMCVGAVVMLLKNFIVEEWKLLNGSIGTVIDIIYDTPQGPRETDSMPKFIVVDFKRSCVPEDKKCFEDCPATYVSIPVITERCEKGCCTMTTIPLRVCIAITIYKGQGITVGPGEEFERIVVHIPINASRPVTGQELVQFSRAKDLKYIAVGNQPDELVTDKLLKIGKTKGNEKRKEFMQFLQCKEEETLCFFREEISKLNPNGQGNGTFDDGCNFLLNWYRSTYN
jgi:PIF1 helicase.